MAEITTKDLKTDVFSMRADQVRAGDRLVGPTDRKGIAATTAITQVGVTASGLVTLHSHTELFIVAASAQVSVLRILTPEEATLVGKSRPSWMG